MDVCYCSMGNWKFSIYQAINISLTFIILTWVQVLKHLDHIHVCSRKSQSWILAGLLAALLRTGRDSRERESLTQWRSCNLWVQQLKFCLVSVMPAPKCSCSDNVRDHFTKVCLIPHLSLAFSWCWVGFFPLPCPCCVCSRIAFAAMNMNPSFASCVGL